jgi:cation:H+ antiporter
VDFSAIPAWLMFLISAAVVVGAGARLAHDGDAIADQTRLGAAWVGAILVASATSLPEIATDVAAVRQGEISLAVGDLFGSSMANMLILGVADLLARDVRLLTHATLQQAMVGALAIGLTAVAAAGALAPDEYTVFNVGWAPLVIGFGYVLGSRLLHSNRRDSDTPADEPDPATSQKPDDGRSLKRAITGFIIATALILVAAPSLARSAATLAEQWGISSGFFGVVFLAAATSLPEVSVVSAAIRAGSYTLAVGNLLGSNCFNMVILLVLDIVDGSGALLARVEPGVVMGAIFAILLMTLVLLDLVNRPERRIWYLEPGPVLIVLAYAAGIFLTYQATV